MGSYRSFTCFLQQLRILGTSLTVTSTSVCCYNAASKSVTFGGQYFQLFQGSSALSSFRQCAATSTTVQSHTASLRPPWGQEDYNKSSITLPDLGDAEHHMMRHLAMQRRPCNLDFHSWKPLSEAVLVQSGGNAPASALPALADSCQDGANELAAVPHTSGDRVVSRLQWAALLFAARHPFTAGGSAKRCFSRAQEGLLWWGLWGTARGFQSSSVPRQGTCKRAPRSLAWPHGASGCSVPLSNFGHLLSMPLSLELTPDLRLLEASSILQRLQVLQFRELLDDIGEEHLSIPYHQLLSLCTESGAAATKQEAMRVCEALNTAGVVLRYRDRVYLRPLEISEALLMALPDTRQEMEERIRKVEERLKPLEALKQKVDKEARRHATKLLRWGLAFFSFGWLLFVRLTFWDLGWDHMEPITYYVTTFMGLLAYYFYLSYRRPLSVTSMDEYLMATQKERLYAEHGLDLREYERLKRQHHRDMRYLENMA
eukprot:jgi/Botrbrau1/15617/Bobra.4_1s0005.1